MNRPNFIYSITLVLLFMYAPLYGMDLIQKTVANYFKTSQQKVFEQQEVINEASFNLEITIKKFQKINDQLSLTAKTNNQSHQKLASIHSQYKTNIIKNISCFIELIKEYDVTLQTKNSSCRENALQNNISFLKNNKHIITNEELKYLIATIQEVRNITTKNIKNTINNNPMENSTIQLESHGLKNPNRWPDSAEEQIKYINNLNINHDLKIYILRILWDKYRQEKKDIDRNLFAQALRELNASLPSYEYQKGYKQNLPIFTKNITINTKKLSLDDVNNPELETIINKQTNEILKIQQSYNEFTLKKIESLYERIRKSIKKEKLQSINISTEALIKRKNILSTYIKLLSDDNVKPDQKAILLTEQKKEILKIQQILLMQQMNPLLLEMRANTKNNESQNLTTLIAYKDLLQEYINNLSDIIILSIDKQEKKENAQEKKEQEEILNNLNTKINFLAIDREREAKEIANKEAKEKERLEKEKLNLQKKTEQLIENQNYTNKEPLTKKNRDKPMENTLNKLIILDEKSKEVHREIVDTKILIEKKIEKNTNEIIKKTESVDCKNPLINEQTKNLTNQGQEQHITQNNIQVITDREAAEKAEKEKLEKAAKEKAELEAGRILNLKLMEQIILERAKKEQKEREEEQLKLYEEYRKNKALQEKLEKEKLEKETQEKLKQQKLEKQKLKKEAKEKTEQEAKKKAQEKAALEKLEKEKLEQLKKEQEIEKLATDKKIKEQVEAALKKENYERKMGYIYKGGAIFTTIASFIALLVYNQDLLKNLLLSINTDTLRNLLSAVKLY